MGRSPSINEKTRWLRSALLTSEYAADTKKFVYFSAAPMNNEETEQEENKITSDDLDKMLKVLGREAIREKTPTIRDLERSLQVLLASQGNCEQDLENREEKQQAKYENPLSGAAIIAQLIQRGYLKESDKWLTDKGFINIGARILRDITKALQAGELGMHETKSLGRGGVLLDSTKRFERGDDTRSINVPKSLLNTVHRLKSNASLQIPLRIEEFDLEEYETLDDVRAAVVYCIDLSSTMRYSSMFGDMSRIETAKRALWGLYLVNQKYFPLDSVFIVGFGALAFKVLPRDIPYLKTFEPGSDFLHYTNYQSALRLASKILQRDGAENKRVVLITDGHPSACFIDDSIEKDKILAQRPYSHFYLPDQDVLNSGFDYAAGKIVYLCYRYRQVDQYIGEKTILEAKKCHRKNIQIDTVMISEEDSLLGYVNDMERQVKGRSYYINPTTLDKVLLTDYLSNKKLIVNSRY